MADVDDGVTLFMKTLAIGNINKIKPWQLIAQREKQESVKMYSRDR